ncbi:MAG: DNA phosphorothioation-associated putative methyltransferase [Rubrivivax sp.]
MSGPSMVGKRVVDDLYIHLDWLDELSDANWRGAIANALAQVDGPVPALPNVAKLNLRRGGLSLLLYPEFDSTPFPELMASWTFHDGPQGPPRFRRYDDTLNPPILHRKELLVGAAHPERAAWGELTASAEALGLFENPSMIGFRMNWERAISQRGFMLRENQFVPIGNDDSDDGSGTPPDESAIIRRHLTALIRTALSAPVQMLVRHGLLDRSVTFFDYGCGRGGDISALASDGFDARGWDPYFAADSEQRTSEVVNLGFVINVIEDAAERVEALQCAFALTRRVLAVGVMLYPSTLNAVPFRDGYLSSRQTFQKYFDQGELRDYLEQVLHEPAFLVAPGIAFIFADKEAEQRFAAGRYRRRQLVDRLLRARSLPRTSRERKQAPVRVRPPKQLKPTALERRILEHRPWLDAIWERALDLGRWPEDDELPHPATGTSTLSPAAARRLMDGLYDYDLLDRARAARSDDVLLFLVAQQFAKRAPYRQLEPRLQRDIRAFFGDYGAAQGAALHILAACADPDRLLTACQEASTRGLGWLDGAHSLQLHIDLIDRLPAILRVYVTCGLVLWDAASEVQLVKIHIGSGKLSLMEYDDFSTSAVPSLRRRIKVNLRRLNYEVFEYGSAAFPKPALLWKSRYLGEEQPDYAGQVAFDEQLSALDLPVDADRLVRAELDSLLETRRLAIDGLALVRSSLLPDIDARCGERFSYRDLVQCGETQHRLGLSNLPLNPESYNALYDLATNLLDPVVEYFGAIRLTYGFASASLTRAIAGRIAPKLDQHACHERDARGRLICDRLGAACDFIVDDEDMLEVADWVIEHLPFDRLYIYGPDRPLHVSYGPQASRMAYIMIPTARGALMPRLYDPAARPPAQRATMRR